MHSQLISFKTQCEQRGSSRQHTQKTNRIFAWHRAATDHRNKTVLGWNFQAVSCLFKCKTLVSTFTHAVVYVHISLLRDCVSAGAVSCSLTRKQFTFIKELLELWHTLQPSSTHTTTQTGLKNTTTTVEDRRQYKHRRRLIGKDFEKRRGLTCKAHRKNT